MCATYEELFYDRLFAGGIPSQFIPLEFSLDFVARQRFVSFLVVTGSFMLSRCREGLCLSIAFEILG